MNMLAEFLRNGVLGLGTFFLSFIPVFQQPINQNQLPLFVETQPTRSTTTSSLPNQTKTNTNPKLSQSETTTPPISTNELETFIASTSPSTSTSTRSTSTTTQVEIISIEQVTTTPPQIGATTSVATTTPWNTIEATTKNALVNIVCFNSANGLIQLNTGTGVVIDPKGVILTNAHIAQYFIFTKDNEANLPAYECAIRNGETATTAYKAKLLYIPSRWIRANASVYKQTQAIGTGERDYALLVITESTQENKTLPSSFSYIPFDDSSKAIQKRNEILLAGYPVYTNGIFSLASDLALITERSRIFDEFTFSKTSLDLVATDETLLARQGASGGAVVSAKGNLVGLLVSTGSNGTGANLNALTLSYINDNFGNDTKKDFTKFIRGDVEKELREMENKMAELRELFVK